MTRLSELPFDIWERITTILGDDMDPDLSDSSDPLKALSLACRAMVPLCQKHLFSTLLLDTASTRSTSLKSIISLNTGLISYIRVLDYRINPNNPRDVEAEGVLKMLLDRSTALKSISVSASSSSPSPESTLTATYLDNIPPSLQSLFKKLFNLSTVTELSLTGLERVPASIFDGCMNLTHLTLGDMEFMDCGDNFDRSLSALGPRLISLEATFTCYDTIQCLTRQRGTDNKRRIVDFDRLERLSMPYGTDKDQQAVWDLLPIARSLQSLELFSCFDLAFPGLGACLLPHTISTLKRLLLHITIYMDDDDPLCGLVPELATIAGINVLEEISVHVQFVPDVACKADTEDWGAFDTLLTTPGSFSKLKLVSLGVSWETETEESNKVSILRQVTEKTFPMLLESETVTLRFESDQIDYPLIQS